MKNKQMKKMEMKEMKIKMEIEMRKTMKSKLFRAAIMSCFLIMFGCSNDPTEDLNLQTEEKMQMTMTMETSPPTTRAKYDDTGSQMLFSWNMGDETSVVVNGVPGNENTRLTAKADGKNADFGGTVIPWEGRKTVYSFYPYSQRGYTVFGGDNKETATASLTLPNPQSYVVGGPVKNSFLVGVGTATVNGTSIAASTSMKQVMTIIRLNITNASKRVIGVRIRTAQPLLPTTATVKMSDATISNPGSRVNILAMNVTDLTTSPTKQISFAMFPINLTGVTVRVEVIFADGSSLWLDKPGTYFSRNKSSVMNFDVARILNNIQWNNLNNYLFYLNGEEYDD